MPRNSFGERPMTDAEHQAPGALSFRSGLRNTGIQDTTP
jgi:hypothetical protein